MRLWWLAILAVIVVAVVLLVRPGTPSSARQNLPVRTPGARTPNNTLQGSSAPTNPPSQTNTTPSAPKTTTATTLTDTINVHAIPLGDGKVSSAPKQGYVYSCAQTFRTGGAQHDGNWIHGDTWDLTQKLSVQGALHWPNAQFTVTTQGDRRIITGNGLPVDSITGNFPISPSDPAYQIDRNPNTVTPYNLSLSLPLDPQAAAQPSCVPMGMVGVSLNGVAIFNALDAAGRDAVAHEVQDACSGHPQEAGIYHYHGPSPCMPGVNKSLTLVGYALDGYGIYSMYDANGTEITDSQLDACHGVTSVVPWDGKMVRMYHYVLTREYPYTIGCFHGTPVHVGGPQKPPRP